MASHDRNEPGDSSEMTPIYDPDASAEQPLLSSSSTSFDSESGTQTTKLSRYVEDAVLSETAVLGRNLSWSSAYILVISRVIGSGIFATPGSIVKTTGSVGLALLLWVVGALLAGCSMMITLEYGCMLPRSGGDKVYLEFTYRHPRFLQAHWWRYMLCCWALRPVIVLCSESMFSMPLSMKSRSSRRRV